MEKLVPVIEGVKQRDTAWVCVCPSCQHERIVSYAQKWNIQKGNSSYKCRACQITDGDIVINKANLKLGRKKYPVKKKFNNKGTYYRNIFAPELTNTLEVKLKQRLAKLGKPSNNTKHGLSDNWTLYYPLVKDKIRESTKRYRKKYPEKHCALQNKRRADKLKRTPKWLSKQQLQDINEIYLKCKIISQETGIKHHVDHIIPLRGKNVSGLHVAWNLQIITQTENCSKGNKV